MRCRCFPSLPAPLLVARLLSSCWKGPAGAEKRKWRCHYYPLPFGCLRPVGKVRQNGRGVTAFSRRFPLRRLLLRCLRFAGLPGRKRGFATGLAEALPLLPFAASPSSPSRLREPAGLGKETVAAGGVRKRFRCAPSPPLLLRPPGFANLPGSEKRPLRRVCCAVAGPCLLSVAALSVLGRGALPEQFAAILTRHPAGLKKGTVAAGGVRKRCHCSPSPPPLLLRPPGKPPRAEKGRCGGVAMRLRAPVCCRQRALSVLGRGTLSVAGSLVWAERRLFSCVCRVGAESLRCCCRRLLSGRKMAFAGVRSAAPAALPYFFECAGRLARFGAGAALCSDASSSCQKAR